MQGDGRGQRILIIHAMTRFGLMEHPSAWEMDVTNNLTESFPAAEFVFTEAGVFNGDYHANFDGEKFTSWLRFRLLPTFEKLFPRKKMTLVMDNAAYHNPVGIHNYRPSAMDTAACVSFFSDRRVRSITVPREHGEARMTLADLSKRAPAGPNRSKKQAAVRLYLKSNPGISLTQTDEILQPGGHSVLWTVPYTLELQPIELLWARVKNKVATQALLRRTTQECREQAGKAFDDVSADDCAQLVDSVHGWITNFMRNDSTGSLRHFESFADLVARGPADLPAELNIPDSDSDASDSDSGEGEAADMELV